VKRKPNLAFDLPSTSCRPLPWLDPADEACFEIEINSVSEFWLPIVLNALSDDIEMKAESSVPEFPMSIIAWLVDTNAKFLADPWASCVRVGCAFLDRPPFFSL
jgi:hypothetical protein